MIVSETKVRVRYADTDQMKMVYYARYFEYFEESRSDLLRLIGMPYPEIERIGYFLPVIEAHAQYLRPARYDDLLVVRAMVKEIPQARIRIEYELINDATRELLATGHTVHTFVSAASGKPSRAPNVFIEHLQKKFSLQGTTTP
jgi:acyl-CoA thioester hydrolase